MSVNDCRCPSRLDALLLLRESFAVWGVESIGVALAVAWGSEGKTRRLVIRLPKQQTAHYTLDLNFDCKFQSSPDTLSTRCLFLGESRGCHLRGASSSFGLRPSLVRGLLRIVEADVHNSIETQVSKLFVPRLCFRQLFEKLSSVPKKSSSPSWPNITGRQGLQSLS